MRMCIIARLHNSIQHLITSYIILAIARAYLRFKVQKASTACVLLQLHWIGLLAAKSRACARAQRPLLLRCPLPALLIHYYSFLLLPYGLLPYSCLFLPYSLPSSCPAPPLRLPYSCLSPAYSLPTPALLVFYCCQPVPIVHT